jgi:thiol:disulfide interchange protein
MTALNLNTLTLACFAIFCAVAAAEGAGFDAAIEEQFVDHAEAKAKAAAEGKPLVVFITEEWCGACKNLKKQINEGSVVKDLLSKFVVTHVSGDAAAEWKQEGHGYVPQNYFFGADGSDLGVEGPNAQYAHFFGSEDALASAMNDALAKGTGAKGEL